MPSILNPVSRDSAKFKSRAGMCALAVMAKAPRPGTVKTRLTPPLTSEQAAGLNACFLQDTAENIAALTSSGPKSDRQAAEIVAYAPVGDEALFESLLPHDFALLPQRGAGFGERLLAAAEDILALGFGGVCLIDSDSPTVPQAAYKLAVAELARTGDRIVLGPTADGGYYLIGMKQAHVAVFEQIHWSTDTVYAETRQRARAANIEVVDLPLWYDVDDAGTLDILKAELLAGIAPGFATQAGYPAVHTREFLMALEQVPSPGIRPLALNAVAVEERRDQSPEGAP